MYNDSLSAYNRLVNLDGIEDRIIYFLLSPNNKDERQLQLTHTLWKLLYYNDCDALNQELPTYEQVTALICDDDVTQTDKRIFRSPHFEDAWNEENTLLKIYVDQIIPVDRYKAIVNVGIDIITHNRCVNINVADEEKSAPIDHVNGVDIKIAMKSRVTTLLKAIVGLLNGREVEGVGTFEFSNTMSRFQQAQYGIWNNRNFEGIKIVMGCYMSGVA